MSGPAASNFSPERADFLAADAEFGELFGVNRIELFFAQQRNVDGIDVRVEHGFGQTRRADGAAVVSSVISCTFMRARRATSSGGGAVSSGVRNSPSFRARAPRLRRLVNTLNGMESTMPASTGVNHQNSVWSSCHMNTPQTSPISVCPQCRRTRKEPRRAVRARVFAAPSPR